MSRAAFDDDCIGCRPVICRLDGTASTPLPDTHPMMVAILRVWSAASLDEKIAWHAVTCLNEVTPGNLAVVKPLMDRMSGAVSALEAIAMSN